MALGCSGEFELAVASDAAEIEPPRGDAPFVWDPRDFAARDVPPPSRAAAWSWPEPDAFRARFEERATDARSFGIAVGKHIDVDGEVNQCIYVNEHGVETLTKRVAFSVAVWTDGSPTTLAFDRGVPLRDGGPFLRVEEVTAGDPLQPGRFSFGHAMDPKYFDVEYALPPRRLHDEDFRDWVYARTLVESGLELAAANAESTRELITDDGDATAAEAREAELGVDCYESGLVGCYLAGRLGLIMGGLARVPSPHLRPAIDPEVLARGPVDLTRFFIGYLVDEMVVNTPAIQRFNWRLSMPFWVAFAAFDSGHAPTLKDELFRRARDPARDMWSRVYMLSALTALLDLDGAPREKWPMDPYDVVEAANTECALAVLAERFWTMDQAFERCVVQPRHAAEALAFQYIGSRFPWWNREAYVDPPSADALMKSP